MALKELQYALLLLVAIGLQVVTSQDSLYCSTSVCGDHQGINDLPPYTETNRTICDPNTRWPSPEVCNCGTQCVKNLELGQNCKLSKSNFPETLEVCGPGLKCTRDEDDRTKKTCQPYNHKKCVQESVSYSEDQASGVLGPGRYQPVCDDLGDYSPRQCSTASTCYCVDKHGDKIFGDGPMTTMKDINCLCAKFWDDSSKIGRQAGFRCLANGNFDKLQCINKQYCFCFDPIVGDVTEGPWGFSMMPMLSCYNETLHGLNYTQPCSEALEEYEKNLENEDKDVIIIGQSNKPQCGPDGYYSAVQYEGNTAYCADPMGNPIENFLVSLSEAFGIKCACARRRYLMEQGGLGSSKPKCHKSGDFCRVQKRGLFAYCVDGNGNQAGPTMSIDDAVDLDCDVLPGTKDCLTMSS